MDGGLSQRWDRVVCHYNVPFDRPTTNAFLDFRRVVYQSYRENLSESTYPLHSMSEGSTGPHAESFFWRLSLVFLDRKDRLHTDPFSDILDVGLYVFHKENLTCARISAEIKRKPLSEIKKANNQEDTKTFFHHHAVSSFYKTVISNLRLYTSTLKHAHFQWLRLVKFLYRHVGEVSRDMNRVINA